MHFPVVIADHRSVSCCHRAHTHIPIRLDRRHLARTLGDRLRVGALHQNEGVGSTDYSVDHPRLTDGSGTLRRNEDTAAEAACLLKEGVQLNAHSKGLHLVDDKQRPLGAWLALGDPPFRPTNVVLGSVHEPR